MPEHVLETIEVAPLLEALQDQSVEVRTSVFGALTRLPLSPVDWLRVAEFVEQVLDSGRSPAERLSVIRASPWIPVRSVRERANALVDESDRQALRTAVRTLASTRGAGWPEGAADASPLHPMWVTAVAPPGFALDIASQVSDERTRLSGTGLSDTLSWLSPDIASLVDAGFVGLPAAAVTDLFEDQFKDAEWAHAWGIGNHIVAVVEAVQGRFRPDLEGLFALYRRATTKFLDRGSDVAVFLDEDWEDGLRGTCWQLAWIVSRGGLRGLVPGLAAHLRSEDREERVTAALLIADAADYVLHPYGPKFGGGIGPGRGPTREVLIDDSPYRLPQRSTLDPSLEGDWVQCSAFAPPGASPASTFLVQAFAHIPDQARDEAERMAKQFDPTTDWRAVKTLECKVSRGTRLHFNLTMPGLKVDDPEQRLVWNGKTESVQFGVSVPREHGLGAVVGTLTVSQDWVPIGHIKFTVKITSAGIIGSRQYTEPISIVGEHARRYTSAFVSYATADRTRVLEGVQALPRCGVRVFVDVLDLEPGERWKRSLYRRIDESDIVLLFWSTAAKRSKWVRREIGYALKRQNGDEFASPTIGPVVIEGQPVPSPWKEIAHLHFNDRMIYFMQRPTTKAAADRQRRRTPRKPE